MPSRYADFFAQNFPHNDTQHPPCAPTQSLAQRTQYALSKSRLADSKAQRPPPIPSRHNGHGGASRVETELSDMPGMDWDHLQLVLRRKHEDACGQYAAYEEALEQTELSIKIVLQKYKTDPFLTCVTGCALLDQLEYHYGYRDKYEDELVRLKRRMKSLVKQRYVVQQHQWREAERRRMVKWEEDRARGRRELEARKRTDFRNKASIITERIVRRVEMERRVTTEAELGPMRLHGKRLFRADGFPACDEVTAFWNGQFAAL